MICDELESMIPVFLDDKLNYRQLEEFLKHVDECKECRNELELNYIIKYGFSDEYGVDDYDFISMIDNEISNKKNFVEYVKRWKLTRIITFAVTNLIILICMIYMLWL